MSTGTQIGGLLVTPGLKEVADELGVEYTVVRGDGIFGTVETTHGLFVSVRVTRKQCTTVDAVIEVRDEGARFEARFEACDERPPKRALNLYRDKTTPSGGTKLSTQPRELTARECEKLLCKYSEMLELKRLRERELEKKENTSPRPVVDPDESPEAAAATDYILAKVKEIRAHVLKEWGLEVRQQCGGYIGDFDDDWTRNFHLAEPGAPYRE
jgi:hypothetical protein